jgi:hypothetical protein
MEVLGWVLVGIIAAIILAAATLGLISIPDARRYLRIRRM